MDSLTKLQLQIRYVFLDASLLKDALTHPSHGSEHQKVARNDKGQFAFVGDAVISLALADREIAGGKGEMTTQRAERARNEFLARLAGQIELPLSLGEGEKKNELGKQKRLASGLEAVIGAIYHDAGAAHALLVARRLLSEGPARPLG